MHQPLCFQGLFLPAFTELDGSDLSASVSNSFLAAFWIVDYNTDLVFCFVFDLVSCIFGFVVLRTVSFFM